MNQSVYPRPTTSISLGNWTIQIKCYYNKCLETKNKKDGSSVLTRGTDSSEPTIAEVK